jgi:hypothetical protein
MPGGNKDAWQTVQPILQAISAKVEGEPCCQWVGENGAGHYVKMVISVNGAPKSSALIPVHFPVPFWPAVSKILSTKGSPSSSLKPRILLHAVFLHKKKSE